VTGGTAIASQDELVTDRQPEPQWLTDTESATWANVVRLIMLLPGALDRQLREDAGIPHAYFGILARLSAEPRHALRMTDLARHANTTTSRLSHAVSALEQRGWIERHPCPTDKRGQIAQLTDAGMALLEAAAPDHVAEVRRLVFDHLTADDVDQLRVITAKLMPGLTGDDQSTPA
jgi:DNA-binding MarR family transcriptional regulator